MRKCHYFQCLTVWTKNALLSSLITKIKRLPLLNTIFEENVVLCVACLLSYVFEIMGELLNLNDYSIGIKY